jgi:hypothetical protein
MDLETLKAYAGCAGCTRKSDCLRLTVNPTTIRRVEAGEECKDKTAKHL